MAKSNGSTPTCPWCDGTNVFHLCGSRGRAMDRDTPNTRPCAHPPRVLIRQVAGATWQRAKWELTDGATRPLREAKPYAPPSDAPGRMFARALARAPRLEAEALDN